MTISEFEAFLRAVEYRHCFPAKRPLVRVAFERTTREVVSVEFSFDAPDRDTGAETRVYEGVTIPVHMLMSSDIRWAAEWLRREWKYMIAHEIDEAMHFGGERMFDPHMH